MEERKKILILENDDFLRELLGNLLHKKGLYILNGFNIKDGVDRVGKQHIDIVILGSSCADYAAQKSIHYLNTLLDHPKIFFIAHDNKIIDQAPKEQQMKIKDLSVQHIINEVCA